MRGSSSLLCLFARERLLLIPLYLPPDNVVVPCNARARNESAGAGAGAQEDQELPVVHGSSAAGFGRSASMRLAEVASESDCEAYFGSVHGARGLANNWHAERGRLEKRLYDACSNC